MTNVRPTRTTNPSSGEGLVDWALVGAGGALGAVTRALAGALVAGLGGPGWLATQTVNLAGAFALGALVGRLETHGPRPRLRAFVGIGFLGAFTTFSTLVGEGREFALATPGSVTLTIEGLYLMGSIALGLGSFHVAQRWIERGARRSPGGGAP